MSPKPVIETSQYDDRTVIPHEDRYGCPCYACVTHREQHERPRVRRLRGLPLALLLSTILWILIILGGILAWQGIADARIEPIKAPHSLLRARHACPNDATLVACRGALRKAYAAVEWQRKENLKLARQMLGKLADWTCIHRGEGSWTAATGNGYWGGLQMDRTFMRLYGMDMIKRHHGGLANTWTPREQIIVAQRAYAQHRGYAPWPQTSRKCGLR